MDLTKSQALMHLQVFLVVSSLIFTYRGQIFCLPLVTFAFCTLGSVVRVHASENLGKEVFEHLIFLHIPCDRISSFLPERAYIFPDLPFITDKVAEFLLVPLYAPAWIYFYLGFSFPNLIPSCSDNFFVVLPVNLFLLTLLIDLLSLLQLNITYRKRTTDQHRVMKEIIEDPLNRLK